MVKFKEFKIDYLFENCNLKRIKKSFRKKYDLSSVKNDEFDLPLINSKFGNNGIMYYGRSTDWESEEMTIGIISDGAIATGLVYAHPQKTGTLYNAYQIRLKKKPVNLSLEILLFLTTALQKSIQSKFSYERKATWDRVRLEKIKLPVCNNEQIDWQYMDEYICKLECKYINRLECYLKDKGLDDYKLTDKEEGLLNRKNIRFRPFKLAKSYVLRKQLHEVSDTGIFNIRPTNKKINANTISFGNGRPYVARGEGKNGIRGLINYDEKYLNPGNTISFGQDTATMYYQNQSYFTGDKILILSLNEGYGQLDEEVALYLIGAMKKTFSLYGWGRGSYAIDSISFLNVYLPISKDNMPDFDYMRNYIKAIQKRLIRNVINYKDELTNRAKNVISIS